jgi:hypothetical protein
VSGEHPYDWYPSKDYAVLEMVCDRFWRGAAAPPGGAVVEIGSWTGQSAELIASYDSSLICVDPWGIGVGEWWGPPAVEAYDVFRRNLPTVTRFRCGWQEFAAVFDGPLAFAHIDAVHEYEDVKGNVEAFLPILAPGGVLCGHDANDGRFPGLDAAVVECLPDVEVSEHVWWWQKP